MAGDGRGDIIKLKLLFYIHHLTSQKAREPTISVSKRKLRDLYNGRYLDDYLEELIKKGYLIAEQVK